MNINRIEHSQKSLHLKNRWSIWDYETKQGRNHGWKVEGDQGLAPNTGALAPRAGLGVGCGRGRPLPLWGSGVSPPENFWKLRCQIRHSGDCLLWNSLYFENYGQKVGGPIHCWSPT